MIANLILTCLLIVSRSLNSRKWEEV